MHQDKRIEEAKKLLQAVLADRQQEITGPRPPKNELSYTYEKLLEELSAIRGAPLFFPYIGSGNGKGTLVELLDGSVKYDLITGIGVHAFGHCHSKLMEILVESCLEDTVMQGHLQQNIDTLLFSRLLKKESGLDHCFISSSGAMANENALKIAFQANFPKKRILAFDNCFMGRSLYLSSLNDKPHFREGLPLLGEVDYLPFFNPHEPEKSTEKCLTTLRKILRRYPNQHAVLCLELIQGEGGFYKGAKTFFETIFQAVKEEQIFIFVDEVQTFGRTDHLFAYQHFGLSSYVDICTIGKLSQCCATLFRNKLKPKPGLLSQTFTASTTALRTGAFVVNELITNNYFGEKGRNQQIHDRFARGLEKIAEKFPGVISGPWGIGVMIAFTLFDGTMPRIQKFIKRLFTNGVLAFIAGTEPTRVRLLVPMLCIQNHEIDDCLEIIEKTIQQELE